MLRPFCMLVHTGIGLVAGLKETYSDSRLMPEADVANNNLCCSTGAGIITG